MGQHERRFLWEHEITYPVAMAAGGVVRAFGGARALPTSFLVDGQGRIRHTVTGIFTELALEQAVSRLLAEPVDATPVDSAGAVPVRVGVAEGTR